MGVSFRTVRNFIPGIERNINGLKGKKINVGVYGEEAWLAGIHEYGCTIKPGSGKYLTVPCNPEAKGKRVGDFDDLFCITSKKGYKMLVRKKGKDEVEPMFLLMSEVKIPERSFLRAGFDECINDINRKSDILLRNVASGAMSTESYLNYIGDMLATKIKSYATDKIAPPNSETTVRTKSSNNPLNDEGGMLNAITYEVK